MNLTPKKENENLGFRYHVTLEQMREHQKRTPEEIFQWIEEYALFLQTFQTEEEKAITRKLKNKQTWLD